MPVSPPPWAFKSAVEVKLMRHPPLLPPGGGTFSPGLVGGLGSTRVKGASAPQPENSDAARTAAANTFTHVGVNFPQDILCSPHPISPSPRNRGRRRGAGYSFTRGLAKPPLSAKPIEPPLNAPLALFGMDSLRLARFLLGPGLTWSPAFDSS